MGNFCSRCGKPLEEGQVCDCTTQQQEQPPQYQQYYQQYQQGQQSQQYYQQPQPGQQSQQYYQQPQPGEQSQQYYQQPQPGQQSQQYYQQPQQGQQFQQAPGGGQTYMGNQFYNEQYQKMKQKSSTYISTLVQTFLSIFRYPYNKGKEYVSGANEKLAIGFIAVHAIFSGLFSLVIARQINYTFDQLSNALSSQSSWSNSSSLLSGSKSVSNVMEVSYAKFFFIVLIFSALFSFILAGLLFVANKVLKGNASFKEILCLTSIRSVVISPFILVSLLLAFLSPMLGAYLFIGCEILAMFYVYAATPVNDPNAKERLPIVMFVVVLLFVIISFIIMKNAVVLLLPDKLKDAMDQISNFSFNQYLN